ncbi:hypothetical protein Sjap_011122 [Stephania japonica]|uniref:Uncharacterized protein n=1 Tax=Stephania japonica TaxID=461633 RepID=A0AAP0JCP5_9MAGN
MEKRQFKKAVENHKEGHTFQISTLSIEYEITLNLTNPNVREKRHVWAERELQKRSIYSRIQEGF